MIKVTKTLRRRHPERFIDGARAFVSSNTSKAIDPFFEKHKIYGLNFKCATWSSLRNRAAKLDIAELQTVFGPKAQIRWSRTAGCSCGCSPGYVITGDIPSEYRNMNVFADIKTDVSTLKSEMPKYETRLAKELAKKKI